MKKDEKFDDTKLVDAICQLKAYLRIMEVFIEYHWENEALNDIGIIIDKISDIVNDLEKEYVE